MCGIAGIFTSKAPDQQRTAAVQAMQRALQHRGPDDAGIWGSATTGTVLAHTRLSIIDLSAAGHQPMHSPDGRFHLTFNGEIYNFREQRTELEKSGVMFRTQSDSEVLLELFSRRGESCLRDLRGMFAFALWDEREQRGYLARDGFGIKPVYWTEQDRALIFASELRALMAGEWVKRKVDATALAHYFETGSVPEPLSLIEGVRTLEAGSLIEWTTSNSTSRKWWQIRFDPDSTASPVETIERVRAALLDSVEHHFVSDVPVGVFLSGGIDSTALLALAKASGRDNIRTFSIGVDDAALDESSAASRTAAHFQTLHEESRLDALRGRELFGTFLGALDQPSIDGFNTYCVSALAHEKGMKVVLSGLGGDELFAGYPSFDRVPHLLKQTRMLGPFRRATGWALERFAPQPALRRLGGAMQGDDTLREVYKAFRGVFSRGDALRLAAHFTGSEPAVRTDDLSNPADQPTKRDDISALELSRYMRNQLLKDSDVMSMVHGLELRVPLVDKCLFETLSRVPASLRLRQGKKLLLEAVPEVPPWVAGAPKRGFLFPYRQWLDTPDWKPAFDKALHGLPVRSENWYQRWSVFVFDQWRKLHGITG